MNRFAILLSIVFISCSNSNPKTENQTFSKDSISGNIIDTISSAKFSKLEFKGEDGFLSSIFDDTSQVRKIQQYVNQISKRKFKDSLELENEGFMENMTYEGGSLTGYFQNGKLLQINEWIGLSYGVTQRNFYFNNDRLVYVLEIALRNRSLKI
jgi:hypothetical protein